MAQEFPLRVFTQSKRLVDAMVSEAVLPAFDGEVGILAGHQNFIGLVGTGVLKVVRDGDDYWYMVSSGVFEVMNGDVTLLVEVGEEPDDKRVEGERTKLKELEQSFATQNTMTPEAEQTRLEIERAKARLEVHRRTATLN